MSSPPLPPIIIDTREQRPYAFAGCDTVRACLPSGDYSVQGLEAGIAIERKSLADFVGSVTVGRERFWRELERLRPLRVRAVVVEASLAQIERGAYRSTVSPRAIFATVLAISVDFQIPVILAGNRASAEAATLWMLRRAWGHAGDLGLLEQLLPGAHEGAEETHG